MEEYMIPLFNTYLNTSDTIRYRIQYMTLQLNISVNNFVKE